MIIIAPRPINWIVRLLHRHIIGLLQESCVVLVAFYVYRFSRGNVHLFSFRSRLASHDCLIKARRRIK